MSVVGHLRLENDTRLHRRFLAKHARAKLYAGFSDFQFYKLTVEKLHYVGGFASALWISKKNAVLPKSAWRDIAVSEESILRHMNSDHQEAIRLYGTKLLKKRGRHWSLIGVDPEGLDLLCGLTIHRLPFDSLVTNADNCRKMLVRLAKQARDSNAAQSAAALRMMKNTPYQSLKTAASRAEWAVKNLLKICHGKGQVAVAPLSYQL